MAKRVIKAYRHPNTYRYPKAADVAKNYIGCQFIYTFNNGEKVRAILDYLSISGSVFCDGYYISDGEWGDLEIMDIKAEGKLELILKPVSSMPEDVERVYYNLCKNSKDTPSSLFFLFENYYDAFGLIHRKEAIDYYTLDPLPKK